MSTEPAWKAEKAAMDAEDGGHGPYLSWAFDSEGAQELKRQLWQDFVEWARQHLGQGYSLACAEGSPLDPVTLWAFKAYMAGRQPPPPASNLKGEKELGRPTVVQRTV